jgi:hypothetical protein
VHATYTFDFLKTISEQLKESLDALDPTVLGDAALTSLSAFQSENNSKQGVYLLYYAGVPVYLGKANNLHERLRQHRRKLLGRQNIEADKIAYKALLLDKSMSTAANEDVLISLFSETHEDLWNGRGFGPKDPGKERDTTAPSWFDRSFPIIKNLPVEGLANSENLGRVLRTMKASLPFVFRFDVPADQLAKTIDLTSVPRSADRLLQHVVNEMGGAWRGIIISYGMLLYDNDKKYPHGTVLIPT